MYKRVFGVVFATMFLFWMQGCSNVEIGFEEGSIFYTKKENPYANERVLSVYLDPLLEKKAYRLVIDDEDTRITLRPGVVTRFGIYKDQVDIVLLEGEKKVAVLKLALPQKKEYALRIFLGEDGKIRMQPLKSSLLPKNAPRSGLYVSRKIANDKKSVPLQKQVKQSEEEAQEEETTLTYELDDGE